MGVAWPYQSWMLFQRGNPRLGIEELSPPKFFAHCYEISKRFFDGNYVQVQQVAGINVGLDSLPAFSGTGEERSDLFKLIGNRWGYNLEDKNFTEIERKQVNACISFTVFRSLCRATGSRSSASYVWEPHRPN